MSEAGERSIAPLKPHSAALWVGLLTLAAAVLRLLHLGAKGLWFDEPLTVALARISWPSFKVLWHGGEAAYQGAYFLLMRGWLLLGDTEAWIRLPSAIFAIASIPLIYLVARRLIGNRAALAAAALLAFSSTDVYYSQEARSYTMGIFLVLLSTWFFVRAVEGGRERDWLLWSVCGALAVYTHFFAVLVLVAQACSLFALKAAPWRRMILHAALILALTAPGLPFLFHGRPPHDPSFTPWPRATPKQLLHLATFLGGSSEKLVLSAILWCAALKAIWQRRHSADAQEFWRDALVVSCAVVPVLLLALISISEPLFVQRYLIFCLPATVMLAGRGMIELPKRSLGAWLVVAWCALSLANIFMGYQKPREDWRSATAAVLASASPGDAVVIYPFFARSGFDYYYDRHSGVSELRSFPRFYDRGEDENTFQHAIAENPRPFRHVWIMMRDQGGGRSELNEYAPDVAVELQSTFGKPRIIKYTGLTVLEFGG